MSHTDRVMELPVGFGAIAHTALRPVAAFENRARRIYGVQFHPEVDNTRRGMDVLGNFLFRVCAAKGDYTMQGYIDRQIEAVRAGGR